MVRSAAFGDLPSQITHLDHSGDPFIPVTGMVYDSRRAFPGCLFIAIRGFRTDSHKYVPQALERGAVAVVLEREVPLPEGVPWIKVADSRLALAQAAVFFYGNPAGKLRLVGVTGTNGKTTTTHFLERMFWEAERPVGLLGTITNRFGARTWKTEHTTAEASDLQEILAELTELQANYAVLEVSSHALELKRVAGCEFDVAVFTNLTQDHLDFHPDMESYFTTKTRLFMKLAEGEKEGPKYAVINSDDGWGRRLEAMAPVPVVTYGLAEGAQVKAANIKLTQQGTSFVVHSEKGRFHQRLKLVGRFNVYNALAAWAVGLGEGIDQEVIARALENVCSVPGRMENIYTGQDFSVIVDYAHTPDGLENLLRTVRAFTRGRMITVFGCGGDRDRRKRPLMGKIASEWSDLVVVTSDNPRTEEPQAIIDDILPGLNQTGAGYLMIIDRRQAIKVAIAAAAAGDSVVIAGKGHEAYQIVGDRVLTFDDRVVAREILKEAGWGAGAY